MIDRESKSQADLKGILKALQRTTSLAEENMLINSFPRLYAEHCKLGPALSAQEVVAAQPEVLLHGIANTERAP